MELLKNLFSSGDFRPHGYCYLWDARLVWLHVLSDALIALAYVSIPITLVYFVRKRKDVPFNWMFVCFGVFIVACGATHVMEVVTLWFATYWVSGGVKVITAVASVSTAILLVRLVPEALALPHPDVLRTANELLAKQAVTLRDQAAELARANAELAATNRELEAFTYSVSHDLRAPLRHIDGFSRILLQDIGPSFDADARRNLERIRVATQHMGHLMDDLLNLARVGRREMQPQITGLNALVDEVVADLNLGTAGRQVEWRISPLPFAECDPGLLKQVFANLLSNALKYTRPRESAVIEVGHTTVEGRATIFVRDNGVGFNMKYADKLFGVFQRMHRQEEFEGTGVGLAIVQRIIRKHGGRIWAEAEQDKGATFYFTLRSLGETRTNGIPDPGEEAWQTK